MLSATRRPRDDEGLLRAAFRELHGARLHGFALLVTLGDRRLGGRIAADALAEGARHVRELTHPERAGAWLRHRVLREASKGRQARLDRDERLAVLGPLGVDADTFDALASFSIAERGALIGSAVEGLDPIDLEVVLGADSRTVHRQSVELRQRFLTRRAARAPRAPLPASPSPRDLRAAVAGALPAPGLASRVQEISTSVIGWQRR